MISALMPVLFEFVLEVCIYCQLKLCFVEKKQISLFSETQSDLIILYYVFFMLNY